MAYNCHFNIVEEPHAAPSVVVHGGKRPKPQPRCPHGTRTASWHFKLLSMDGSTCFKHHVRKLSGITAHVQACDIFSDHGSGLLHETVNL